jgi:hypothetical protein
MNTERIKELAEQAGSTHKQSLGVYQFYGYELEKFAELIAAEEREACAKVCEVKKKMYEERASTLKNIKPQVAEIARMTCDFIAIAIRARGDE